MPPRGAVNPPPPWLPRLVLLLALAMLPALCSAAADSAPRPFRVPAGEAADTLKQFAAQAQREIMFPAAPLAGVRTPAVAGTFAPRAALDRLLAGTGLAVVEEPATGAFMILRPAPVASAMPPPAAAKPFPTLGTTTETMTTPAKKTRLASLLAIALASPYVTSADAAAAAKPDETVVLSPFTVSTEKDHGYQAIDSLAGGRIATNVLKTPADQTILTREFLDDIAADNYIDAGRWLTGANMDRPSGGQDFGQGVVFRGISPAGYPYRNYFRSLGPVDDYAVERLDAARGPNALIFADGVIGGIINTNTKRALFGRPRTELRMRLNSEGSIRAALDVNRQLTDALSTRVNVVAENEKRYNMFEQRRRGAHLAASFRPWHKTELRLEAEAIDLAYYGATTSRFSDQVSSWNGVTSATGPLTGNPGGGVSRQTTGKVVYGTAFAATGPLDFLNYGANTTGTGLGLTQTDRSFNVVLPKLDRTFQFITPNMPSLQRQMAIGAYFEKQVSDNFAFEVAVHRSRQDRTNEPNGGTGNYHIDINTHLPNGAVNPKFGHAYTETNADHSSGDNRNTDFRAAVVYTLQSQHFSHRFNLLAGWRQEDFIAVTDRYARSNNAAVPNLNNGANLTILRRYFSDGARQSLARPTSGQNGHTFDWVRTQDRFQKQELRNLQLAVVGSYLRDTLTVVGGLGYYDYKQYQKDILSAGANGQPTRIGYSAITTPVSTTRTSIGATWFPIKQVGIYVNQSTSFFPVTSGDPGLDGKQFDPTDGQGYGYGLRGNLLNGRITGSIGYYNSSEKNRVSSFTTSNFNSIWNSLNKSERAFTVNNFRDRSDIESSGYEAELTANLGKGLRVFGNIAFPQTAQDNTVKGLRAYYAANIAEWQAGTTDQNLAANVRTSIQTQITAINAIIDGQTPGRTPNGKQKFTANIFANYAFQQASLRGLRLGAGANVIGRRVIGNQLNRPLDLYYGEARYIATASASYDFKVRNRPVTLQLNVSNLLDYEKPIFTSALTNAITNNRAVGNGYYYEDPRKFTLTTSVKF